MIVVPLLTDIFWSLIVSFTIVLCDLLSVSLCRICRTADTGFLYGFFQTHAVLDLKEVAAAILGVSEFQLGASAWLAVHDSRLRDVDILFGAYSVVISQVCISTPMDWMASISHCSLSQGRRYCGMPYLSMPPGWLRFSKI